MMVVLPDFYLLNESKQTLEIKFDKASLKNNNAVLNSNLPSSPCSSKSAV